MASLLCKQDDITGNTPLLYALKINRTSCIKSLVRGHPGSILVPNKFDNKLPVEVAKDDDCKEIVTWVSLQDPDIVLACLAKVDDKDLTKKIIVYWDSCLGDIEKMKDHNVLKGLSLYDLVQKNYLGTDGLSWELYSKALDFDVDLKVYGMEVGEVKAKVQQHRPTPIVPKYGIVEERASTSDSSQDPVRNSAKSTDPVRNSADPSEDPVRNSAESTDPVEKQVKRRGASVEVTMEDEEYTRIKRQREEREHEMAMKVLETKLKAEEERLKAEQEKFKYYQSLRSSTQNGKE